VEEILLIEQYMCLHIVISRFEVRKKKGLIFQNPEIQNCEEITIVDLGGRRSSPVDLRGTDMNHRFI
jgi:hypothetical protein